MQIRAERPADIAGIRAVHLAAFETTTEADLVDALREQARPVISLVADDEGMPIGHILFSPVTLVAHPELNLMGLAPMAVVPGRQRQGIGSALAREGLDECARLDVDAVVVLGHAEYYPRFGFTPAGRFGIRCEYEIPAEYFMVIELKQGILGSKSGTIRYHPAFANA